MRLSVLVQCFSNLIVINVNMLTLLCSISDVALGHGAISLSIGFLGEICWKDGKLSVFYWGKASNCLEKAF